MYQVASNCCVTAHRPALQTPRVVFEYPCKAVKGCRRTFLATLLGQRWGVRKEHITHLHTLDEADKRCAEVK
jgi:hypothetical protein